MKTSDILILMLVIAAFVFWLLWRRECRARSDQFSVQLQESNEMRRKADDLQQEIDRLRVSLTAAESQCAEAVEEMAAMTQAFREFAQANITDENRRQLSRIGWGVYFDKNTDYADQMKKALDAARMIAESGRAVRAAPGAELKPEIVACVLDAFDGYVRYYLEKNVPQQRRVHMVKLAFFLVNLRIKESLQYSITQEYLDAQLRCIDIKGKLDEYRRMKRIQDQEQRDLERDLERCAEIRCELQQTEDKARIAELERQLEMLAPAISNAQLTRRGTVYVISNVGSFGKDVYKIGMTRRTDPQERVDELGVASVPFPFDVHAFIATDDAPQLEHELHKIFKDQKINAEAVQGREFYRVDLESIKSKVRALGYGRVRWVDLPAERYINPTQAHAPGSDTAPAKAPAAPALPKPAPSIASEADLMRLLDAHGVRWIDKRGVGGCLWIADSPRDAKALAEARIDGKRLEKASKTKHFGGRPGWFLPK